MLDRSKLDTVNRIAEKAFQDFFKNDKKDYLAYTAVETGKKGTSVEKVFMTSTGKVREHVGDRVVNRDRANKTTILIKAYEETHGFPGLDVRQDKAGVIADFTAQIYENASGWYDRLAFEKLIAGFTQAGPDAVSFFSTAHPNGAAGATQSNRGTSALSLTALDTVIQTMRSWKGENGEPLSVTPATLIVGPKNQRLAEEILNGSTRGAVYAADGTESGTRVAAAGVSNGAGSYKLQLVVDDRLSGDYDDYWFVVGSKGSYKPVLLCEATAPAPATDYDPKLDEVNVMLHGDLGLGYGLWQTCFGTIL